jgi:hypothetical protein
MIGFFGTIRDRAFFDRTSNDMEDEPGRMRSFEDFTLSAHVMSLPSPHSESFTFVSFFVSVFAPLFGRPCLAGKAIEEDGAGLKTESAKSFKDDGTTAASLGETVLDDLFATKGMRPRMIVDVCETGVGSCLAPGTQWRTNNIAMIARIPLT